MAKAIKCYDYNGKEFASIGQMCEFYKINRTTFCDRKKQGLSLEECLSPEPIKKTTAKYKVGDINYNFQGLKMTIIKDYGYGIIDVQFDDGYVREKAHSSEFKNGTIRNHMIPALCGVGILGDIKTKENGKFIKEYATWANMLQRCYSKEKQKEFPRYKGCSICDEWLYFPDFYNWCHEQTNWDKVVENPKMFHIDKDILVKGNKVYSPNTCCFVPAIVNTLFVKCNAMRGNLPIGVSFHRGKYRARYSNPITNEKFCKCGFDNPVSAFNYYKNKKEEVIKYVAQIEFEKGTITETCYNAMVNYEVEITD